MVLCCINKASLSLSTLTTTSWHDTLIHEAAKAVKYGGVKPDEALKFVTLNPAKQLRIDQYVGSIEVGKQADIVLWSSSPLSTMSRCEQTWIDGRKYFDRQEDITRRTATAALRNQLVQKVLDSGEETLGAGERAENPAGEWVRHDEFCHAKGNKQTGSATLIRIDRGCFTAADEFNSYQANQYR
jgi:hypothetical protein